MSGFLSPLDAYREDLARAKGRTRLGGDDEYWIILATGLRRLIQAPARWRAAGARRLAAALESFQTEHQDSTPATPVAGKTQTGRPAAVADALSRFTDPDAASTFVGQVRGAIADAEEAGALLLAREMLTDLSALAGHAPALDRGLVLLQLGRIARTLGDLDDARDFLKAAGDLGRATETRELEIRESLAQGVLARTRGNHPAARELFAAAAQAASEIGLVDVSGLAHQGLMIEFAEVGDFDTALGHGSRALSAARAHGAREAETLINLAQLCADAGYHAAALGAFAAALARTSVPRLRLPALAGTATAAGWLGDSLRVAAAERRIAAEASDAFPFETARAWLAVARAKVAVGEPVAADAAARKAAAIGKAHGFHEVTHHVERDVRPIPVSLSRTGLEVIKSLETWSDDPSVELALSSASMG